LVLKDQPLPEKKPHRCLLPEKFSEKSSFQTDSKKSPDVIDLGFGFKSNCSPEMSKL
jgi:hypothetical protein